MKRIFAVSMVAFVGACGSYDTLNSRTGQTVSAELPGYPTDINCNPQPEYIYSKAGDLIETIMPVKHPSCSEDVAKNGSSTGTNSSNGGSFFTTALNRVRGPSYDDPVTTTTSALTSNPNASNPSGTPVVGVPNTGNPATGNPNSGTPTTGTPTTGTPTTGTPTTGTPTTGTPTTGTPTTGTPTTGTPGTETPGTETPGTETPGTETPGTETPGTETPGTETPGTETPGTETPRTETPRTETPRTETPRTETPSEGGCAVNDCPGFDPSTLSDDEIRRNHPDFAAANGL